MVPPVLALNQPSSNLSIGGSATLKCRISSISRHATLVWTVDNVTYNTSGTFNTSRGQIVLSYSAFDSVVACSLSSNLTILNVSMDSEGIYTCTAIENNFVVKYNASLVVSSNTQTSSSNSGESFFQTQELVVVLYCFRISSCDRGSNNRGYNISFSFDWIRIDGGNISILSAS